MVSLIVRGLGHLSIDFIINGIHELLNEYMYLLLECVHSKLLRPGLQPCQGKKLQTSDLLLRCVAARVREIHVFMMHVFLDQIFSWCLLRRPGCTVLNPPD